MYQPWRTFAAIINKCLSGKIIGFHKLRLSRAQILWGMFYKKNINFVKLLWEDFTFKIENKDHKKQEKMMTAILGTMRFVSKSKDFQIYGVVLPNRMTNQWIREFDAYKTYLIYTTGAASPKLKRKLKKFTSPSKKRTLVTSAGVQIRDTLGVSVSKKKAPAKAERSKGIKLLSDVTLLKEAQLKKALRRSKRETTIHQAGSLSEGADSESKVCDEPKGKSTDTSEGTGLKLGVPDVSKGDSSKSEYESWGDSRDEDVDDQQGDDERTESDDELTKTDNPKTGENEEEIQDDKFVHTLEDYVPTDDESNDVTKEEYERINEEQYGDVNVSLTDAESAEKKDDAEMTVAGPVNVNQEGAGNQVKDDAQATQKTDAPIPSSSILSDYTSKFLNFDNIASTNTEVVSIMDINVQHEVPRASSLLTIHVFVIPEQDVINESKTVITTSAPTIYSLLSSLYPALQQIILIPTPTTTKATTSTTAVPDFETLTALYQRIPDLEKDVKELKDVDKSTTVISTIQSKVPNAVKEYLGSSLDDAMHKVIQKNIADIIKEHSIPAETVERPRQQYARQKSVKDI
ncbi:hypothetical protein Tco_1260351 [Tanacetum coccineum]